MKPSKVTLGDSNDYSLMPRYKLPHNIASPGALIGASNFFALAVAITLFGPGAGAALAAVVGVLVEVPVMLSSATSADAPAAGISGWHPAAAPPQRPNCFERAFLKLQLYRHTNQSRCCVLFPGRSSTPMEPGGKISRR